MREVCISVLFRVIALLIAIRSSLVGCHIQANLLARVVAAINRCMAIAAMKVVTLKIHSRYLLKRNLNLLANNMLRFGLEGCEKII